MEIHFSIETKFGNYNDTLFFPDGASPTEEEINALKEARVQAWFKNFDDKTESTQPVIPEKTEAQHRAFLAKRGL